jgi:peptide/nickel transport system ATP-binding protein
MERIRADFGLAVLFITHDLRVAAQICDRLLVMHGGEVVETGPTFDLFQAPRHAYTRTLITAAPGREWSSQREAS